MAKKIKKKPAKKAVKKATKKVVKKTAKKAGKKPAAKAAKKPVAKKVVKKAAKKKVAKKAAPKKAAAKKPAVQVEKKLVGINPYLNFDGNCEAAFNFYRSVFGGKFAVMSRFNEMPPMEGMPLSEAEGKKIMHVSLPISKETILMGSDTSEAMGHKNIVGNNFSISVNATSEKEADKLYNGLSADGQKTMPMSKTFWGSYFGMLVDKFGIAWMVSFDAN